MVADTINRKQWDGDSWDDYTDYNTYTFGTGTDYALGAVVSMASDSYRFGNDSDAKDTSNSTTYDWYDGAVIASQTFDRDTNSITNILKVSTFTNSPSGITTLVTIADDAPRRVKFTTDMNGEVLIRDEDKKTTGTTYLANGPYEVWHRFNGREMNYTTNNAEVGVANGQLDYRTSIAKRTAKPSTTTTGMFAGGGSTTGKLWLDADNSYETINTWKQGASGGRHTVRAGETLQSIAQSTWGDSALWYKLAEANGLSVDSFLAEGQALTIPAGVVRTSNNASTFKPYDASETLGDTAPTRIKPPKPKKGGLLGKILLAVIAIAVVAIVAPWAAGVVAKAAVGVGLAAGATTATAVSLGAVVGGAIAGAAGSIVSQAVGVATGIQDKFSWKGVALAALGGAVGGALKGVDMFGKIAGSEFLGNAARAAATSVINQGAAVVTGLQPKFDWVGVAAAAVGAGIGGAAGGSKFVQSLGPDLGGLATSGASLLASSASRSLIEGSNFGDNILAGLPDVIAQTIGGVIQRKMTRVPSAVPPATAPSGTAQAAPGATGQTEDDAIVITGAKNRGSPDEVAARLAKHEADVAAKQSLLAASDLPDRTVIPTDFPTREAAEAGYRTWQDNVKAHPNYNRQFDAETDANYRKVIASFDPLPVTTNLMSSLSMLTPYLTTHDARPRMFMSAPSNSWLPETVRYRMGEARHLSNQYNRAFADGRYVDGVLGWANERLHSGSILIRAFSDSVGELVHGNPVRARDRTDFLIDYASVAAPELAAIRAMRPVAIAVEGSLPKFTFRGDSRLEAEIFRDGFAPRGNSTDLLAHALDNTRPPSAFVSTSRSYDVASGFADNVYVLRPVNGIDVNRTLGSASPFPLEQEIAIFGKIPPANIRAVTRPAEGVSILNPGYKLR